MKFTVSVGMISEGDLVALLQRLVCQHLTPDEIVAASYKKNLPGYSPTLEPTITSRPRRAIMVGSNPHYVATLWQDGESEKDD